MAIYMMSMHRLIKLSEGCCFIMTSYMVPVYQLVHGVHSGHYLEFLHSLNATFQQASSVNVSLALSKSEFGRVFFPDGTLNHNSRRFPTWAH